MLKLKHNSSDQLTILYQTEQGEVLAHPQTR